MHHFLDVVKNEKLSVHQIFNCDETGLYFRLLPQQTLAAAFEKSADGQKKSKDRVTLNLCSNASGSIKVPVQLIGRFKQPRCFRGVKMELLPVIYSSQKNAWMTATLFHEWFHNCFVPHICRELASLGLESKAILLLDNCSAHPDAGELTSNDGKIFAIYLPPNVTSLIQPMDQGVIECVKRRYKRKLLQKLVLEDEHGTSVIDFLKTIDMKVVSDMISKAWNELDASTLNKSWRKIIPSSDESPADASRDEVSVDTVELADFTIMLESLGYQVAEADVSEWLYGDVNTPAFQLFTDEEICEEVMREESPVVEDEEEIEQIEQEVSHFAIARMFEKCLAWLQHQPEATASNTSVLRELKLLANSKCFS